MKYICFHNHYYQPPRENIWLDEIFDQPSAHPFRNWNEKINFESYAPNTVARILNDQSQIISIQNNFEFTSFNIGPTLFSWLRRNDPTTYHRIIQADQRTYQQYGFGNAIAQVYNHLIMPLADRKDKITQVKWGIYDFELRYHRKPKGMWLAETAVDLETLEILSDHNIEFTILSPNQIDAIWSKGEWMKVDTESFDTGKVYEVALSNGKKINIFFYNGNISHQIAFGGLLNDGRSFASTLVNHLDNMEEGDLLHVAVDGETYGHHHKYGEMALASCISVLKEYEQVTIISYEGYLSLKPDVVQARIKENTSWSCAHGVGRWHLDCGCNTGSNPQWNQKWRSSLRQALNWLRDQLDHLCTRLGTELFFDLWKARNEYISLIENRSESNLNRFLISNVVNPQNADVTKVLRIMEIQHLSQLMFTSCAWFFDDISGIETIQVLQYACRAMDLVEKLEKLNLKNDFIDLLESAQSNFHNKGNGKDLFIKEVLSKDLDLDQVAAHVCVHSLFYNERKYVDLYNYTCNFVKYEVFNIQSASIYLGAAILQSKITFASDHFYFAIIHDKSYHLQGFLTHSNVDLDTLATTLKIKYLNIYDPQLIIDLNHHFGYYSFTFDSLFPNDKKKILDQFTQNHFDEMMKEMSMVYHKHSPIIKKYRDNDLVIKEGFMSIVLFSFVAEILDALKHQEEINFDKLDKIKNELNTWKVSNAYTQDISYRCAEIVYYLFQRFDLTGLNHYVQSAVRLMIWASDVQIQVNYWRSQNMVYDQIISNKYWFIEDGLAEKIMQHLNFAPNIYD